MSYQGRHPAAFINAIAEEGTKLEAVEYLQKEWDTNCDLREELTRTREALKEAKEALTDIKPDTPTWWLAKYARVIAAANLAHRPTTPAPKWIPVSERLPEDGEVLAVSHSGKMIVEEASEIRRLWKAREPNESSYFSHWMPLPEQPILEEVLSV